MVLILDVEKVLAEIMDKSDEEVYAGVSESPVTKGKHALVADDSLVARKQIVKTLERLGMTADQVTTGKEAWERMQYWADVAHEQGKTFNDLVQIILTDIEMPEMDGFSLVKHIREDSRFGQIPIVMHSSLSGSCNVDKGRSVGVTDYVTKFDAKHLRETIVKIFQGQSNA
ncbi:MAG: response regulator [Nitrospirae bacterium]|nr:MAG: response regulator [Nitrospirota bacterium]